MPRIPIARLRFVEDLLASGAPTSSAAAVCALEFKISERQAWRYVRRVLDEWAAADQAERPSKRARRIRFLEQVAHDAYINREYNAAIAATRQLCKIEGLEQLALKHSAEDHRGISMMTSDENRKSLAGLIEKVRARPEEAMSNQSQPAPVAD